MSGTKHFTITHHRPPQDDEEILDNSWVTWFCKLEDHNLLCEVDEDYIKDAFNLYGLKPKFQQYDLAMEMILSNDPPTEEELEDARLHQVYQEAADLYGLIHARYIVSPKGLSIMREKYVLGKFGVCPRVLCERQPVLPMGLSEELRASRVKVYCPRCEDAYLPKKKCKDIDGAYFGCTFPHVLLVSYPELHPMPLTATFVPRIYGFRIHKKKGSRVFDDSKKKSNEISYYGNDMLKKMKNTLNNALGYGPEKSSIASILEGKRKEEDMILEEYNPQNLIKK